MRRPYFFVLLLSLFPLTVVAPFPAQAAAWQADFSVRVRSPKVKEISAQGKIYHRDFKTRIELTGSDEIDLYDFEQSTETRIFPADQIYFVKPLSLAKRIKGLKEGWGPVSLPFQETRVLFREDTFQGKTAKLYFVTLAREGQKAYLFRWVSADDDIPLRVIYTGTARETIIVDFTPLPGAPPPPHYFQPPKNYLSLNPF